MGKKRWLVLAALACFSAGAITACGETEEPETGEIFEYTENYYGWTANLKQGVKVENVEVPSEYEGKQVSEINGFANNTYVKTVSLPTTLRSLPQEAFRGCSSLTELTVPDTVTDIGWGILRDCNAIQSLTVPFLGDYEFAYDTEDGTVRYFFAEDYGSVPESLKTLVITKNKEIRSDAFEDCEKLERITLPSNLTQIERDAFKECTSLTEVHITDINAWLNIDFENLEANPLSKAGKLYLNGELLEEVTADCASLKYAVFYNCTSLKTLILGENLQSIRESALEGCVNLTYNVKDGVNYLANPNTDYAWAMSVADNTITSYTAPEETVGICSYALDGCPNLKTLTVGNNVRHFGENVLGSSPVEEATLAHAMWLGEGARASMRKITLTHATSLHSQFSDYAKLEEINLPETLITTGQNAFAYCTSLKSIVLPASLRSLGYSSFNGCTGLETIEIKNAEMIINNNVPFWSCTHLKKLIVPTMDEDKFTLKKLLNPNCVVEELKIVSGTKIPEEACNGFSKLQKVTIADSITYIGEKAFKGCTDLTSFNITSGLRYVRKEAFAGCTNVTFTLATTEGQWKLVKNNSSVYYWNSPEAVKGYLVTGSYVSTYHWERYR